MYPQINCVSIPLHSEYRREGVQLKMKPQNNIKQPHSFYISQTQYVACKYDTVSVGADYLS